MPEPFPLGRPARLAVFASGRGSNLAALLAAFPPQGVAHGVAHGGATGGATGGADAEGRIALVVSDRADAGALGLARAAGVEALHLPFGRDRHAFEEAAGDALARRRIDLVLLAGFMRVLSPAFVDAWRGRLLNVHPSLLPAFPGLHAVERALAAGATHAGCTVQFVDAGVDTGPVIGQRAVAVLPDDDVEALRERIQAAEHQLFPACARAVLRGERRWHDPEGRP